VVGTDPELSEGRFSLTIEGGQRIAFPVEVVREAVFSETGGLLAVRRILSWGTYADRTDEYRKALEIVREKLGRQWEIVEDFSPFEPTFQRELQRAGVLLIPEMEQGTPTAEQAKKFRPLAADFLRRGGKIVILGPTNNHVEFMKTADLLDVSAPTTADGATVSLTPEGKRLFRDAGESFITTNSTYFYVINEGIKAIPLAGARSSAPIVGRRVGQGWIIIMGMDYHSHNDQTVKILIDALTLR
jgi:hypothetical protein